MYIVETNGRRVEIPVSIEKAIMVYTMSVRKSTHIPKKVDVDERVRVIREENDAFFALLNAIGAFADSYAVELLESHLA